MKIDITEKLSIPEGVTLEINNDIIKVTGKKGSNERKIFHPKIKVEKIDNQLMFKTKKATKREKIFLNTLKAHIRNLIKGVKDGYEYKLKICSGHFPMNVSVQGKELIIKNFFGEKKPRKVKLIDNVEVKVEGDIIKINGIDIDLVSQTASKIELATRRTDYDRRVYQDGIWIIKKAK
ncbi:50S ribosomal protein L6 [Candidatus Woesearchaeota archaeon]|nr:50S ribosomal protein L6 [Candidatus Woesearchaeota archaeon]